MNYLELFDKLKSLHTDQHWRIEDYTKSAPAAVLFFMNDKMQMSVYIDHSILVEADNLYPDERDLINDFLSNRNKFNWFNFQGERPSLDDQIATVIKAIQDDSYTAKYFREHSIFVRNDGKRLVDSNGTILTEMDNRIAYDSLLAFFRNQKGDDTI